MDILELIFIAQIIQIGILGLSAWLLGKKVNFSLVKTKKIKKPKHVEIDIVKPKVEIEKIKKSNIKSESLEVKIDNERLKRLQEQRKI